MSEFIQMCIATEQENTTLKKENAALKQENSELTAKLANKNETKKYICPCGKTLSAYHPPSVLKAHERSDHHLAFLKGKQSTAELVASAHNLEISENVKIQMEDPKKEKLSKYFKERRDLAYRDCECGGKSSAIPSFAKKHNKSQMHNKFVLCQMV